MMWFQREHPNVIFGDIRAETLTVTDRSHGNESGTRTIRIEPDTLMDFRAIPFGDGTFKLVVFDPPHLVRAGPRSWLAAKYGKLSDDWRDDLRQGFAECFRVLESDGVFIFKWNETQVKVGELLALTPVKPLFGHVSGRKGLTHCNGFHIILAICCSIAAWSGQWLYAIFILLMLIYLQLDEIHDTIKRRAHD
jgi:hypothetical protein